MDALGQILSQIFYFIIIIGVLVLIHELGHFLAAKAFGMRVERFSIGFPPRAFGKQIGDTDYCVSWLPIGGYVKISGMVDESLDTAALEAEPQPWEFRAKPVRPRIIVIIAGVVMNILLSIVIFWGINLTQGTQHHKITTVGSVVAGSVAETYGLASGDRIISVNNNETKTWESIREAVLYAQLSKDLVVRVERNGAIETVSIPYKAIEKLEAGDLGIAPKGSTTFIAAVEPGLPASRIGITDGDVIVSLNNEAVSTPSDVVRIISANPQKPVKVIWTREGKPIPNLGFP